MGKSFQTFAAALFAAGVLVESVQGSPTGMTIASRPTRPVQAPMQPSAQPPADRVVAAPRSPVKSTSPWGSVKNAVSSSPLLTAFKSDKKPVVPAAKPKTDSISLNTPAGPPTPQLMISTAQLCEERGDIVQARGIYQRSLATWPGNAEMLRAAARMEDRQGNLSVAENLYGQVVNATPQNAGALNDLGLCLARQGKLDASLTVLEQAVRLEPGKPLFRNNAATVCIELRQDQRAMAHLSAVHAPADVQFNMGQLLVARKRISEAERYFKLALDINPNMQEASMALAAISTARQPVPPGVPEATVAESASTPFAVGAESIAPAAGPETTTQSQSAPQGSPQLGPQLGPQTTYPSEARSSDGYGRSTYSLPSYTPPSYQPTNGIPQQAAVPSTSAGGFAQGGVQGTVPWVGQASPRYLPPTGTVAPGAKR